MVELEELKTKNKDKELVLGVTKFYDMSNEEFNKIYKMDSKFFNPKEYQPKSKIFDPESFVSKQLFGKDSNWLPKFINDLFNDKDFDFFKAVLGQEEKDSDNAPQSNFMDFMNQDIFKQFTLFDINKEIKDIMSHMG